jgi:ABC-type antimicrobial peptide transport system permease subunit
VHVNGDPTGFASRLREISAEIEPDLALLSLEPLHLARERELRFYAWWLRVIYGVSGLAILLSLAGIYSVMSFTVARRTREIGVRVALGAGRARVAGAVFRRPLMQVGAGLLSGFLLGMVLSGVVIGSDASGRTLAMMLGYGLVMTAVCLSACIVPTRRALGIEPTEALSAEA